MTDPLELLGRPDRPVAPSSEFRRELLERIRQETATMPESSTTSAAAPSAEITTPQVTIERGEYRDGTAVKRGWFMRPLAAVLGALFIVVAIGSVGLLFRSSSDPELPVDGTGPVTTVPVPPASTPPATGGFDGTTALLPAGFSPVAASPFDGGFLIVATDTPPRSGELPAMNATLFVAESEGVRPVIELTDRPVQVVWDGTFVWVAYFETGAVSKIDLASGTVVGSVTPELVEPVSADGDRRFIPNDLEAGLGSIWLLTARGAVAQIDPTTVEVRRIMELTPPHPEDLALGPTSAWVAQDDNTLVEINPQSGATTAYPLEHRGQRVVTSGDSVFVWGGRDATSESAVTIVNEGIGQVGVVDTGTTARTFGIIGDRVGVLFDDGTFRDVYYSDIELGPSVVSNWDGVSELIGSTAGLIQLDSGGRVTWVGLAASGGVSIPVRDFIELRPVSDAFAQSPDWVRLAEPPIADRWPAAKVWTGSEIIVFGGERLGGGGAFTDGAVYNIERNEWRLMAQTLITIGTEPGWVWTGNELIVWDAPDTAAAYDPETDTWRIVESWPLSGSFYPRAIWTGVRIIDIEAGLSVDPDAGLSQPISSPPAIPDRAIPVWTGDLIVLSTGGPAYRPATDEWIDTGANTLTQLSSGAAWTGSEVIAVDYESRAARYDTATGDWQSLAPIPFNFGEWIPWTHRVATTVAVESWPGMLIYQRTSDSWAHFSKPTVADRSVQLIPAGDDLYAWDGGLHRLTTPITDQPLRSQLQGLIVDRPAEWEPVGPSVEPSTTATIVLGNTDSGAQCRITATETDAWRALAELPPGKVVQIQPVAGGDTIQMIQTQDETGVTLSWAPFTTVVAQVQCPSRQEAATIASYTWTPWQ